MTERRTLRRWKDDSFSAILNELGPPADIPGAIPSRTVVEVRANRLRCLWVAAVGLAMYLGFLLLDPGGSHDRLSGFLFGMVSAAGLFPAIAAANLMLTRPYLRFDPQTGRVVAPGWWSWQAAYPRRGFDRIEYSIYDARICEVRTDGKRRRLPIIRWFANRRDWAVLVDVLLAQQAMRAGGTETASA